MDDHFGKAIKGVYTKLSKGYEIILMYLYFYEYLCIW